MVNAKFYVDTKHPSLVADCMAL